MIKDCYKIAFNLFFNSPLKFYFIFFKILIKTRDMADNEAAINNVVLTLKYLVIMPAHVGIRSDAKPVNILKATNWPVDFIFSLVKS
jgi:hypothetical protein